MDEEEENYIPFNPKDQNYIPFNLKEERMEIEGKEEKCKGEEDFGNYIPFNSMLGKKEKKEEEDGGNYIAFYSIEGGEEKDNGNHVPIIERNEDTITIKENDSETLDNSDSGSYIELESNTPAEEKMKIIPVLNNSGKYNLHTSDAKKKLQISEDMNLSTDQMEMIKNVDSTVNIPHSENHFLNSFHEKMAWLREKKERTSEEIMSTHKEISIICNNFASKKNFKKKKKR